jgi:hypothetical protein
VIGVVVEFINIFLVRLRRHKLNESYAYLFSTCPAISGAKSGYRSVERFIEIYAGPEKENPATRGLGKVGVLSRQACVALQ